MEILQKEILLQNEETNDLLNIQFTKAELNHALRKIRMSSPSNDQICYVMINDITGGHVSGDSDFQIQNWKE